MERKIMNKQVIIYSLCSILAGVGLSGCVQPGPVDDSLLARSQRALVQRGAQDRRGGEGLDSLRPEPVPGIGQLEVHQDEPNGRKYLKLSLEESIMRALVNNLDIRVVAFDPTISREEVIKAAADFDYTEFGNFGYTKVDEASIPSFIGNAAFQSKTHQLEAGLKQRFVTGAQWSLSYTFQRVWDDSPLNAGTATRYEPTLVFQVTQPLLRNAGTQLNLANLRAARLNERASMAGFRQKVEEVATQVISIYWTLVLAREDLGIQERLLERTEETYERVKAREDLDATAVEIQQSLSSVETRRASVVAARKAVKDAEDAMRRLLSDPQINLASDVEIVPSTVMASESASIREDEQVAIALGHNPTLEQAQLTVEVAEIAIEVAENQAMPDVNVNASAGLQGLDESYNSSHDVLSTGDYFNWSAGISVEYPLGNRQRKAELRRAKAEQTKAITSRQRSMDDVATLVKERIREVRSTYEQWQNQQEAVKAAIKELEALEDVERIRGQLSPEFLNVKLQAQLSLAVAERAQWQALASYNIALTELAQATGTVLSLYPVNSALPVVAGEAGQSNGIGLR